MLVGAIGLDLVKNVPIMLAWLAGIVLAVLMVRRGGARAEKLFLAGCSLMLAESLVSPFSRVLIMWLIAHQNVSAQRIGFTMSIAQIPLAIISLAGIVCLVIAFWKKFKAGLTPTPIPKDKT